MVWKLFVVIRLHTFPWWCPGRLAGLYAPYQILVLNSGVWYPLLLDIRSLWRHNMTTYSRFYASVWRNILTQHAYYATRTLFTRCCTMCHCSEHNYQRSKLGDRRKIKHSTWRQSSSRVPTVMENPGKINFPGKSWKIDKNSKVMEKLKNHSKFWTDEKGTKFFKFFNVSKR